MRRLIINADDLGLTPGVNRAIFESSQRGVVTSATLMANGGAFDDAVRSLQITTPAKLSIGCHLVLVDGEPLSPVERVPSLMKGTEFRRGIGELGLAARRHKLDPTEIEAEATAQFKKLWAAGLKPSHFDAHKHAHMFPEILEPALRAARSCNIPAVRNPFEPQRPLPLSFLAKYRKLLKRYLQVRLLRTMRSSWLRLVRQAGLRTPDGSFGVITTGDVDTTLVRVLLENMPEGTWELVCHPGYNDADLGKVRTRLRDSRDKELSILASPETRSLIDSLGIELITYNEL